ncbi:Uncharacterized protein DBV15_10008 [Temnothorax longispinosus]|uniref:Uncharacterized protein n=1 Tax=Temnothorax longispinosus TaxID=300112 RepID=A0A4S2KUZ2_9HYME|nr:Uncharacterized protein DBV15_10008 [Temnothorax longispinosus]
MGKNVTLFSYMVMQHAAHLENLSSYTGPTRARRGSPEMGAIAYTVLWELRNCRVLPEHSGWIANRSLRFPVRRRYIFARVASCSTANERKVAMSAFAFALVVQSGGVRQIAERTAEDRESSEESIDRIMGLNDNDATAYVSHRLTPFVCSLITCPEYDATLLRSTDS